MVSVAIMQPVYLPWLGYFEQIARTDSFIFLDDVQYTKYDWRNRNRIRTPEGSVWLTIPVVHDALEEPINKKMVFRKGWKRKNLETLRHNYARCPFYKEVSALYAAVISIESQLLVDYTIPLIQEICRYLGLSVPEKKASTIERSTTTRQDRILELCRSVGANTLYTGPAAKNYMDLEYMRAEGLSVVYQDYDHPKYKQAYPGFESHMSVLDLLMNHGPNSLAIITGKHQGGP